MRDAERDWQLCRGGAVGNDFLAATIAAFATPAI